MPACFRTIRRVTRYLDKRALCCLCLPRHTVYMYIRTVSSQLQLRSGIPYFLIQFPPLNSFLPVIISEAKIQLIRQKLKFPTISKFKKEQFPQKLYTGGITVIISLASYPHQTILNVTIRIDPSVVICTVIFMLCSYSHLFR